MKCQVWYNQQVLYQRTLAAMKVFNRDMNNDDFVAQNQIVLFTFIIVGNWNFVRKCRIYTKDSALSIQDSSQIYSNKNFSRKQSSSSSSWTRSKSRIQMFLSFFCTGDSLLVVVLFWEVVDAWNYVMFLTLWQKGFMRLPTQFWLTFCGWRLSDKAINMFATQLPERNGVQFALEAVIK